MPRTRVIVRFLVVLLCAAPLAGAQQAAAALAPPDQTPVGEEDDERETGAKEHAPAPTKHRPPARACPNRLLPPSPSPLSSRARTTPPVAADPFRNGLGSPYRC
jgi:hypothetical protein